MLSSYHLLKFKFVELFNSSFCTPIIHESSRWGWLTPVLSHHRSCGSASGGSVVQRCAYALHYLFLTLSVLIIYSQFPTYPQISNLFRATAIFKYQINSVCLIPTVKSFPPLTFISFLGTTTWTDFCMFSHILQYGLLRSKSVHYPAKRTIQTSPVKVRNLSLHLSATFTQYTFG